MIIRNRVNPHNFRHSRATFLANLFTEAQMKEHFGWAQELKMAAVCVHLSGRDVDKAVPKAYGLEGVEETEESIMTPKECVRCRLSNQATNRFFTRCGLPLDEEAMAEVMQKDMERRDADQVLERLLDDKEFGEMLINKVQSMNKVGST